MLLFSKLVLSGHTELRAFSWWFMFTNPLKSNINHCYTANCYSEDVEDDDGADGDDYDDDDGDDDDGTCSSQLLICWRPSSGALACEMEIYSAFIPAPPICESLQIKPHSVC